MPKNSRRARRKIARLLIGYGLAAPRRSDPHRVGRTLLEHSTDGTLLEEVTTRRASWHARHLAQPASWFAQHFTESGHAVALCSTEDVRQRLVAPTRVLNRVERVEIQFALAVRLHLRGGLEHDSAHDRMLAERGAAERSVAAVSLARCVNDAATRDEGRVRAHLRGARRRRPAPMSGGARGRPLCGQHAAGALLPAAITAGRRARAPRCARSRAQGWWR